VFQAYIISRLVNRDFPYMVYSRESLLQRRKFPRLLLNSKNYPPWTPLIYIPLPGIVSCFRGVPDGTPYTQASLAYALSRIVMTLTTAYGCTLVGEYFGFIGITALLIVFIGIYLVSVFMFSPSPNKVESVNKNYPAEPHLQKSNATS
jgi:hypothetical protein